MNKIYDLQKTSNLIVSDKGVDKALFFASHLYGMSLSVILASKASSAVATLESKA